MRKEQAITDNLAIGLSILCVMQCLAVPSILVLLPSVVAYHLQNEAFHFWMIVVVLPVSVFALTLGCKQHNRYHVMIFGVIGLVLLVSAIVAGDVFFGENGEKILTILGAGFVTVGHLMNFRLCRQSGSEECVH
ncbi:MerC domain-containing protein [Porticoccaceae bacterium]|nr:MerC domain-containing protein [Porticoccaceae bacterium]MDA8681425.1 MerC domain-containing protein [Porticoccaceae bacterium]MDB2634019.1 MerC domain-containing protein [Porticoccaceae bacterium]MDB2664247.1 MerC domain-containing protein [Porticoccaceae bacterium]